MNIQTKASFKKEVISFFRTYTFVIVALVIIGLAALSPIMITGMAFIMDAMSELSNEIGVDVTEITNLLDTSSSSTGVISSISDITGVGLIVFLLLINKAAGGELKKRAVIIPRAAGLRSFPYIFPKFIVYPITGFVITFVAMFISWGVSTVVFEANNIAFANVFIAAVLTGVFIMFYTCFHLTIGTATGKAGMSAAICIVASFLLSNIFAVANLDYMFNPFALNSLAASVTVRGSLSSSEIMDIVFTILFALGIMVVAYLIALFAQNAKKIDNTGNEIEL
ncbi:MAG: hypothetical protein LBC73_08125 [Oscillospiraceae bacterium]|jgi:hypothetical protein|nr:hypothetical protein [Oscillospiraceae bacterium]